jgi:hypothetical protein
MKIACIAQRQTVPKGGIPAYEAMISALKADGHEIKHHQSPIPADMCLLWSVQFRNPKRREIYDWYRSQGIPVLVIEVGALNRNTLWRVGLNNIDWTAEFGLRQPLETGRYKNIGLNPRPWREDRGERILITLQNDKCANWPYTYSSYEWLIETIRMLKRHTDRKITVRPHPRKRDPIPPEVQRSKGVTVEIPKLEGGGVDRTDFQTMLKSTWAVINVSSNPAVEAVLSGIPAFVASNNLASPVCETDIRRIEHPVLPKRKDWLNRVAHTEWTVEEIRAGIPWQRIKPYVKAATSPATVTDHSQGTAQGR